MATNYDENSSVELKDLESAINSANVADAILIYELLQKNNVEISAELKQSLLELVSFRNSEDLPEEEQIIDRSMTDISKPEVAKWNNGSFADQLFDSMEEKTDAAYNAIIRGKAKYQQALKAHQLFVEALAKNVTIDANTFNHVIPLAYWLHDNPQARLNMLTEVLQTMNDRRVRPNVETLNASLYVVTKIGNNTLARNQCLQLLAEFHRLGVVPTLGTWYYVLAIFYRQQAPRSDILLDILDVIDNKEWRANNESDLNFFATAISVCNQYLHSPEAADRIYALLHFGDNMTLLGTAHKETVFYRNYLKVLMENLPIDEFMRRYETIVPNVHSPEFGLLMGLLQTIDERAAIEYLPKIWSDLIVLQHSNKTKVIELILHTMAHNRTIPDIATHTGLDEKFAQIAWDIHIMIDTQPEKRKFRVDWSGRSLSDALTIICRVNDFEKANALFEKCLQTDVFAVAVVNTEAISQFVELCIADGKPTAAIAALKYNVENVGAAENIKLGKLIVSSLTLAEDHMTKVAVLIGRENL